MLFKMREKKAHLWITMVQKGSNDTNKNSGNFGGKSSSKPREVGSSSLGQALPLCSPRTPGAFPAAVHRDAGEGMHPCPGGWAATAMIQAGGHEHQKWFSCPEEPLLRGQVSGTSATPGL